VAFGEKVPSHISRIWKEYHCLIPNAFDKSSARSLAIPFNSPSIDDVILSISPVKELKIDPIPVDVEVGEDGEVGEASRRL